ncbi:MAG: OmpA family protein [Pseudomonadota bacterium]
MSERRTAERPYPGLRPFRKHEWSIFFGREAMVDAVLEKLTDQRMVVVHGSSGCGKSSLITAGVLPRLEQDASLHGMRWQTGQMRPGRSPLWNLAEEIGRLIERRTDGDPSLEVTRGVRRLLNLGQGALSAIDERYQLARDGNACLLIDQFEELFRYARGVGHEEADTFVDVLKGFAGQAPQGLYAIVTMRSDHLGDCAQFIGFAELVNKTQYLLPRMDKPALMRAIRGPARLFGGEVNIRLAIRLIDDAENELDALPLVQHCLMRLWHKASHDHPQGKPTLTTDGYLGLQQLLSAHADEVLATLVALAPEADSIAEHLFRAITEIDNEGRGVRRPLQRSQLEAITRSGPAALDHVIDGFTHADCSFLVRSADSDPVIDISHEALIRCWTRLCNPDNDATGKRAEGWLYREQEDGRLWHALAVQAESGESISNALASERKTWFDALPGPAWAERYGGHWASVEELVACSSKVAERLMRERQAASVVLRDGTVSAAVILLAFTAIVFSLNRASDPVLAELVMLGRNLPSLVLPRQDTASGEAAADLSPWLADLTSSGLVEVIDSAEGQVIVLPGAKLFTSGSARLQASAEPTILAVAEALSEVQGAIVVTGHTDSVPPSAFGRFKSNWELSAARANAVKRVLALQVEPSRIMAQGLADTLPVAPNDTPASRARNRRVEITLLGRTKRTQ